MNNSIGLMKEKLKTSKKLRNIQSNRYYSISYHVMASFTFKEEIDFKELKNLKETRASFLCGFETLRA